MENLDNEEGVLMKKCPNCGALMEEDVNFCTKCGQDLATIATEVKQEASNQTQVVQKESIDSQFKRYWQWCTESWKHPATSTVEAEQWYGYLTLIIEDILLVLSLYYFAKSILADAMGIAGHMGVNTGNLSGVDIPFNVVLTALLFIIVFQVIVIGSHYLAYKFIYDRQPKLFDFVNRGVHASNFNLIFVTLFFLLMLMGLNSIRFATILLVLIIALFFMGQQVILLADKDAKRDRIYGFLIAFGIIFVCMMVLNSIIYNSVLHTVINEAFSAIH
ncbi:zinc ribbon domain-containing protein [Lactobacillus sp. ESL0228]|nr:zinc ribbon domain-containing protein [Lactobacillus sp. ESL0228]